MLFSEIKKGYRFSLKEGNYLSVLLKLDTEVVAPDIKNKNYKYNSINCDTGILYYISDDEEVEQHDNI
tara:strand:+ start:754 stop:957 length:204 start_codon:yes stop_codon:yes gene_type:complete